MINPRIAGIFLKGVATVLPIGITIYFFYWLIRFAETFTKDLLLLVMPASWYFHGMGLLVCVLVTFAIGLLTEAWLFNRIFAWGERLLERVPLVKSIYASLRDMLAYFSESRRKDFSQVVKVKMEDSELELIGFVTRKTFDDLPQGFGGPEQIAVYLPMSYQVGGYMAIVPKSWVTPLDMKFEEGMRLVLTAGVIRQKGHAKP